MNSKTMILGAMAAILALGSVGAAEAKGFRKHGFHSHGFHHFHGHKLFKLGHGFHFGGYHKCGFWKHGKFWPCKSYHY